SLPFGARARPCAGTPRAPLGPEEPLCRARVLSLAWSRRGDRPRSARRPQLRYRARRRALRLPSHPKPLVTVRRAQLPRRPVSRRDLAQLPGQALGASRAPRARGALELLGAALSR